MTLVDADYSARRKRGAGGETRVDRRGKERGFETRAFSIGSRLLEAGLTGATVGKVVR